MRTMDTEIKLDRFIPMPFSSQYENKGHFNTATWWQWRDRIWRHRVFSRPRGLADG